MSTFTHISTGAAHVENKASIEAWRTEKSRLDAESDLHNILGCVGEPLADVIKNIVERYDISPELRAELVDRATEARGNLLDWTNEHRQEAYNEAFSEAASIAGQVDASDALPEDLAACTFEDVAEHTRDYIERELEGICAYGSAECSQLDDSDLS